MTAAIIVAACCLGFVAGYLLGCERVHRLRRQRAILQRNLDATTSELVDLKNVVYQRLAHKAAS